MYHRLLDQVRHGFYKVYSLFMVDHTPRILFGTRTMVEMPVQEAITSCAQYELNVYVVEVEYHKMPQEPYHEFIVFKVEENSPRGSKATIVVDRFIGNLRAEQQMQETRPEVHITPEIMVDSEATPRPEQVDEAIDYPPIPTFGPQDKQNSLTPTEVAKASVALASSSAIQAAASFFPDHPSRDVITFINEPNDYLKSERPGSIVCRSFKTRIGTFSVAELVTLAHTVHDHNSSYHMIRNQCYWFAYTIYKVTKICCGNVPDNKFHPDSPGTFGGFRVIAKKSMPTDILKKFHDEWKNSKEVIENVSIPLPLHLSA